MTSTLLSPQVADAITQARALNFAAATAVVST
jgi:hypothetical protein